MRHAQPVRSSSAHDRAIPAAVVARQHNEHVLTAKVHHHPVPADRGRRRGAHLPGLGLDRLGGAAGGGRREIRKVRLMQAWNRSGLPMV